VANYWERLKLDYESTISYYQNLAEIRFKLLAFVPTISGAAIALLTRTSVPRADGFVLASLGFIATLGITLYDQRNTQFYDAAIARAKYLEECITAPIPSGDFEYGERLQGSEGSEGSEASGHAEVDGLFNSRPSRGLRFFGIRVGHDPGLALIYSPVLGAWAFAIVKSCWPSGWWLALLVGAIIMGISLIQFRRHDDGKWFRANKRSSEEPDKAETSNSEAQKTRLKADSPKLYG
jgi:hypothetical protein